MPGAQALAHLDIISPEVHLRMPLLGLLADALLMPANCLAIAPLCLLIAKGWLFDLRQYKSSTFSLTI